MRVQVINIDSITRKTCKIYLWSIWKVIEIKIVILNPRTTPHCRKEYIVKNPKSSTGITKLYWYEIKEIPSGEGIGPAVRPMGMLNKDSIKTT